ncbi:hypothetical protein KC19_1G147000 [Ceratodon purpureus]|uniref:Fungal lipase-type domain-containing protein n=1 Tax=Ceratodon purpureus TaxID=3225 RepID=A0A8T0J8J5_CERPU|nr:hypothetical protein KC19_1G147000 [Ceratodon purpureus]
MVHTLAAVMPISQEDVGNVSPSIQECLSFDGVQADGSSVTKAGFTTHRRYHSLDRSGIKMERSSNSVNGLRKTMSGSLNPDWMRGEDSDYYLKNSRHGKDKSRSLSSFDTISGRKEKSAAKERKLEIIGAGRFEQTGTRKGLPSLRGRSAGEARQTQRNRSDVKSESSGSHRIETPTTSSDFATWVSSSRHLEFVSSNGYNSMSRSLHLASLIVLTSYRLRSFSAQDASSREQLGHLESCKAPLSSRWREIQGANNWRCLLDPLDLDLRKEILRYGDFATLTYDNFESETRSKYAGSARFPKQKMFEKLHKQDTGYQVTRYLYATCENPLPRALQFSESWDVESNWMGYVAVATELQEIERLGRRDILVAWRGTVRTIEWLVDAEIQMVPITFAEGKSKLTKMCPKVEKGFWSLYTSKRSKSQFNKKSASEQVIAELTRLLTLYKGENLSITLTGHSLGGALSILTAYEIASRGLNKRQTSSGADETIPVTVFTYGSPSVGNAVFRKKFEEMNLKALRVVEVHDLVPKTMTNFYFPWMVDSYKHVGVELRVDHARSPYLKRTRDPKDCHNMESYLHLVDGHQGLKSNRSFELVTGRDYALVNKYADLLQERYCIPPSWWQVENKGLELTAEGRWVEPERTWEDTPSLLNRERYI